MKVGIRKGKLLDFFRTQELRFDVVELETFDDKEMLDVDAVVAGRMTNEQLVKAKSLKDIFIPFTGQNGFDLDFVEKLGINIHITQIHAKFVAERALALALALLGNITYFDREMHDGRWGKRNFDDRVSWTSLFNKKIGIYGYGEIGRHIHNLVKHFSDEVYAYNRSRKHDVTYVDSLDELVEKCEVIFIATPINEGTRGSINEDLLSKMTGKYLINIGRGAVVSEFGLYRALSTNTLAGYGSDVWYNYPEKGSNEAKPSMYPIEEYNVVMTPHCAGFADGAENLRYLDTLNQINRVTK